MEVHSKALLAHLFPGMTYMGVVNTQIDIYNLHKKMGQMSEQEILNDIISSRIDCSYGEQAEAMSAYGYLMQEKNKNLEDVILAIVNYEYFDSPEQVTLRQQKNIPQEIVDGMRRKCEEYIRNSVRTLAVK